jgi:hypothetical protein
MAANHPGGVRPRPPTQQLSNLVYGNLVNNIVQTNGWQNSCPVNQRLSHTMSLITSSFLAMPNMDHQQLINHGIKYEREAFLNSPDKVRTADPIVVPDKLTPIVYRHHTMEE